MMRSIMRRLAVLPVLLFLLLLTVGAPAGSADTITFDLYAINLGGVGSGPYATVSITTLASGGATITVTGYGPWQLHQTAAAFDLTGGLISSVSSGSFSNDCNNNSVDGWGKFTNCVDIGAAFVDSLTITITGGSWGDGAGSAASVLKLNNDRDNVLFAAHVSNPNLTQLDGSGCTGFAAGDNDSGLTSNSGGGTCNGTSVPETSSLWLLGTGLLGLVGISSKLRTKA